MRPSLREGAMRAEPTELPSAGDALVRWLTTEVSRGRGS
jgi:hypothetical protein